MKYCELCGLENPNEARFCMKCGKDLDAISTSEVPPEMLEPAAFTPAGSAEDGRLGSSRPRRSKGPMPDILSYKEKARADAAALEHTIEDFSEDLPSEIQLTDVKADFVEQLLYCERCGVGNPRDQRYCKQCGSSLGKAAPGVADIIYSSTPSVPLAAQPVEHSLLADIRPASDYYGDAQPARTRERRGAGLSHALEEWGVGQWLGLILATVFAAALIWFFLFGGKDLFFNKGAREIRSAGSAMQKLPSFEYKISATCESEPTGQYPGSGRAVYENPDRNVWELDLAVPGRQPLVNSLVQIGNKPFVNTGSGWQAADPSKTEAAVSGLWSGVYSVEDLGTAPLGRWTCKHYKYRIPSRLVTTVMGAGLQTGVSDAVVEAWIDSSSNQFVRFDVKVYNVQIEGNRTRILLVMDLLSVGQVYNVQPPI